MEDSGLILATQDKPFSVALYFLLAVLAHPPVELSSKHVTNLATECMDRTEQ